jgi:hypothetical protein
MRIKSDEDVAGFPASKIRQLLRQSVDSLSVRHATKTLEINTKEAMQLLKRLERVGFLERNPTSRNPDDEHTWKRTVNGGALANALFSAPVPRQSAEKTLTEFLSRVRQVNCDSRFLYEVRKVVVFGSFLSDAPFVGDLDLAVDLCPKERDSRKHSELIRARANEAASSGRRFRNFVGGFRFAEDEVLMFLKARSRILQLTRCDDGVLNIAESLVIYESPAQNPASMSFVAKPRAPRSRKRPEGLPF